MLSMSRNVRLSVCLSVCVFTFEVSFIKLISLVSIISLLSLLSQLSLIEHNLRCWTEFGDSGRVVDWKRSHAKSWQALRNYLPHLSKLYLYIGLRMSISQTSQPSKNFTDLALWADSVYILQYPWVICVSVCAIAGNPLPSGLETSGQRAYCVLCFKFLWVLGFLPTNLLCIMGELAGGGPVAMAVGISDIWQVTRDTQ